MFKEWAHSVAGDVVPLVVEALAHEHAVLAGLVDVIRLSLKLNAVVIVVAFNMKCCK